jgi:N-acetylmuramic acid 6-phosphate etherase
MNDFPSTEKRNPAAVDSDTLSALDLLRLMNAEDARLPQAVAAELPAIARAVDGITVRMAAGGRLVYLGAGTSGRLGVLDASECPPTFNTSPGQVLAVIAGGAAALTSSVEEVEDDTQAGADDIDRLGLSAQDSLVGISASGRTPYVLGGMQAARRRGALVISLTCNRPSPMEELADIGIAVLTGPEVIAGSTRLKAGSAQKMVLNMLSTGVMVRLGKTYAGLMVDLRPVNAKLRRRAVRILVEASGLPEDEARSVLEHCNGELKTAILSILANIPPEQARKRLATNGGFVRRALEEN